MRVSTRADARPNRFRRHSLTARTGLSGLGFAATGLAVHELARHGWWLQGRARLGAGVSMRSRAAEVMGSARVLAGFVN